MGKFLVAEYLLHRRLVVRVSTWFVYLLSKEVPCHFSEEMNDQKWLENGT